jgi:hypothetical protein
MRTLKRPRRSKQRLDEDLILSWADAYFDRHGKWPTALCGPIPESDGLSWRAVDEALRGGYRGLLPGSSLAILLLEKRGKRHQMYVPHLTDERILVWATQHHDRHGKWPTKDDGPIPDSGGETWCAVDGALIGGGRGLPGGSSLHRLLKENDCVDRPDLTEDTILQWADAYFLLHAKWPTNHSGTIPEAPLESWNTIDYALRLGTRRLRDQTSLAQLLHARRGIRNKSDLQPFTEELLLLWADAYYARHGDWPNENSGPVEESPGDTWQAVQSALCNGKRGQPGGSSIHRLLVNMRRAPPRQRPRLDHNQIRIWVESYHGRHGKYPSCNSRDMVGDTSGETWSAIDAALRQGDRGLPGGSSLAKFIAEAFGLRCPTQPKPPGQRLTNELILSWADAYFERRGRWPTEYSGAIPGSGGDNWRAVNAALNSGCRGLQPGSSLALLLHERRDKPYRMNKPRLTEDMILSWADAHFELHGKWPHMKTGSIPNSGGHTWAGVNSALREGYHGLDRSRSLARLLVDMRGKQP